jgi:hypothetical protein
VRLVLDFDAGLIDDGGAVGVVGLGGGRDDGVVAVALDDGEERPDPQVAFALVLRLRRRPVLDGVGEDGVVEGEPRDLGA